MISSTSKLIDLILLSRFKQNCDTAYAAKGDVDDAISSVETNANDILVLQNTLNALIESGLGEISSYAVILKEESEFETLTAANTVPGVLYFGLEPLGTGDLEFGDGYAVMDAVISNGYAEIAATYDHGYVTL